jgi:hypothetical protein
LTHVGLRFIQLDGGDNEVRARWLFEKFPEIIEEISIDRRSCETKNDEDHPKRPGHPTNEAR